jgi:hypothetical protein
MNLNLIAHWNYQCAFQNYQCLGPIYIQIYWSGTNIQV